MFIQVKLNIRSTLNLCNEIDLDVNILALYKYVVNCYSLGPKLKIDISIDNCKYPKYKYEDDCLYLYFKVDNNTKLEANNLNAVLVDDSIQMECNPVESFITINGEWFEQMYLIPKNSKYGIYYDMGSGIQLENIKLLKKKVESLHTDFPSDEYEVNICKPCDKYLKNEI